MPIPSLDAEYRLPEHFTEDDLRNPAYADPLAQATAPMIDHCRRLLAEIERPDFNGGIQLDCTLNGAQGWLDDFFETLSRYEEGRVPFFVADELVALTQQLIAAEMKHYPEHGVLIHVMSQAFARSALFWRRTLPHPQRPRKAYLKLIFASRDRIVNAICAFNAALFGQPQTHPAKPRQTSKNSKIKSTSRHTSKPPPHSRARRYTDAVEREILAFVECPDFDSGRERHGRTCYEIERAAHAWAQLKHPRNCPRTCEEFIRAYKNIANRRRLKHPPV